MSVFKQRIELFGIVLDSFKRNFHTNLHHQLFIIKQLYRLVRTHISQVLNASSIATGQTLPLFKREKEVITCLTALPMTLCICSWLVHSSSPGFVIFSGIIKQPLLKALFRQFTLYYDTQLHNVSLTLHFNIPSRTTLTTVCDC